MRFSLTSIAALAFAVVSVSAQDADPNFTDAFKPAVGEEIPAGKSYKVEWRLPATAKAGPISILLVGGPTQGQQQVLSTLEKGYDNTKLSYNWAVDAGLGSMAVYGLKFQLESDTTVYQWSNNFKIVGGSAGNDTNTSKSASSSSTTSAPTSKSTMSTSTTTSVQTSGTTTVPPPTVSQPTSSGPAPTGTGPTGTTPTPPANTTRPPVQPGAAAGLSVSGPLGFIGGLAVLMLVL